jgi:hypothetical protein
MLPKRQRERDVREERKAAQNMRGVGPEEQGLPIYWAVLPALRLAVSHNL